MPDERLMLDERVQTGDDEQPAAGLDQLQRESVNGLAPHERVEVQVLLSAEVEASLDEAHRELAQFRFETKQQYGHGDSPKYSHECDAMRPRSQNRLD
jgi:hypothetical protein